MDGFIYNSMASLDHDKNTYKLQPFNLRGVTEITSFTHERRDCGNALCANVVFQYFFAQEAAGVAALLLQSQVLLHQESPLVKSFAARGPSGNALQ